MERSCRKRDACVVHGHRLELTGIGQKGTGLPVPCTRRSALGLPLGALLALVALAAILPSAASGHAIVRPAASRPADLQLYTVTVPTEREVPTVEIDLKIPEGISFLLVQEAPGWKTDVVKKDGRIDEIRWSGSEIAPEHFASFRFIARNPVTEGDIDWRIVQRYAGGEAVRWIGGPDSESPASRTSISESAVPVDVLDIVSGRATASPSDTSDGGGSSDDGESTLALAIAIGGAVAALVALALALAALRRSGRLLPSGTEARIEES